MKISVIIPVYNAERFVEKAVESALLQPETAEVILIEDKSPDNSLDVCKKISAENTKVKLFQHPDKGNHGAGASRNLGIQNAQYEYIAFLDADDFYNSDRFCFARKIILSDFSVDGVYEAIGAKIDNPDYNCKISPESLTTILGKVSPEDLLDVLTIGSFGHFSGDGLLVKKSIFSSCGLFNTDMKLSQDTHMWIKMAAVGKLVPGLIDKPVAMRRVHTDNRISAASGKTMKKYRLMMWESLKKWSIEEELKPDVRFLFDFMDFHTKLHFDNGLDALFLRSNYIKSLAKYSLTHSPQKTVVIIKKFLNKLSKGF